MMRTDGKNQQNLTRHSALDWSPSWSPSSDRIAFGSDRGGNHDVYVMDLDGGNVRNLTRHADIRRRPGLVSRSSSGFYRK